jgi:hypothetical protein
MAKDIRYIAVPVEQHERRGFNANPVVLSVQLLLLILILIGAAVSWRWLDRNLLHWGIEDTRTVEMDSATLVERIRAFEITSMKHSYSAAAGIDISKGLSAGPARVSLPSWLAGQELDVEGNVVVSAGVDMSQVSEDDIEVLRLAEQVQVVISLPPPQILSAELQPGTLDIDTSQGVLTRLRTRLGLSEQDLRDQAVDRLVTAAKAEAVREGLLIEAGRETELRLGALLNAIPKLNGEPVTYIVRVQEPSFD